MPAIGGREGRKKKFMMLLIYIVTKLILFGNTNCPSCCTIEDKSCCSTGNKIKEKGELYTPFFICKAVLSLLLESRDSSWQRPFQCAYSISNGSSINTLMCWAKLLQLCPTLCNPVDCSPAGSSVHGILQARILEWVAMPFSKGYSWPRDRTCIS